MVQSTWFIKDFKTGHKAKRSRAFFQVLKLNRNWWVRLTFRLVIDTGALWIIFQANIYTVKFTSRRRFPGDYVWADGV